jgi:hypothetical protein
MRHLDIRIVPASEARQALTGGDLKSEIAFQNDINTLLACLEEKRPAMRALARPQPPAVPAARGRGGRSGRRRAGNGGAELLAQREVALAESEAEELPKRLVALGEIA